MHALQMKGRCESNRNVWFPFMYYQNWNYYFQNRIIMFCLPVPTLIYLWEIYLFPGSVCQICCRKYVDRSWEYIIRSQTHECGKSGLWDRAIPRKGIHTWDFSCNVAHRVRTLGYPRCFLRASVECICWQVFRGLATFHLDVSPILFHAVKKYKHQSPKHTTLYEIYVL
jgi:hypothetical protein